MIYKIIAKYIKDLKFEIPNPNAFFLLSKNIANYKINIDINSNQIKEKIIEVQTTLALNPIQMPEKDKINTKIIYSTIVEIEGDISKREKLEDIILVKVPNEIYPALREIFIFLFEQSGFKEIKIDKNVDFKKLYKAKSLQ
jgi:preprotein translocase subunit SecB